MHIRNLLIRIIRFSRTGLFYVFQLNKNCNQNQLSFLLFDFCRVPIQASLQWR